MKTVFDNRQCAHVWAQQSQERGRSNNGNVFFEGKTIYSYGYHFPMASFIDLNTVLINSDSYSISTGKQQQYVRNAVGHKDLIFVSTAVLRAFLYDGTFNDQAQHEAISACRYKVETQIEKATAKKAARYKAVNIENARYEVNKCEELFIHFGIAVPSSLYKLIERVKSDNFDAIIQAETERRKKEKAEKQERARIIEQRIREDIETNWINGLPLQSGLSLHQCSKIYMRINGDEIETTRGARFPVAHGKKAFKIIYDCVLNKRNWQRNGKTIHLGHFQIDSIDGDNGTVTAGCHTVEFDVISNMARKLGLV